MGERNLGEENIEPPRESGISKIVGVNEGQEQEVAAKFKIAFEKQSALSEEMLKGYEREKTEDEMILIGEILGKISEFVGKYKGTPINITPDHIHILDGRKLQEEDKRKLGISAREAGGYNWPHQTIYIVDEGNIIENAQHIVHEVLHFNSFQSINADPLEKQISERRIGFTVTNKKKHEVYFQDINEAITEELAKRFDHNYFQDFDVIKKEIKLRENFKKDAKVKPDDISSVAVSELEPLEPGTRRYSLESHLYSYPNERQRLSEIIEAIYETNKEEEGFQSSEDVFKIFAEVAMNGKLLKVADLYERTYGKNSFRALGEETKLKQ